MDAKRLVLALLLVVLGCRSHPSSEFAGNGKMPSREQIVKKAEAWVRETDNLKEEDELHINFDDGNKMWRDLFKDLEQDDPDAARVFHKKLDRRDYQSVLVGRGPHTLGGTYCLLIDRKTGEVITTMMGV